MTFVKNIAHTFGSRIFTLLLSVGTSALVARLLGPEENGRVILILTAPMFLYMMTNLGLGSSFSYYAARKKYNIKSIVNAAIQSSFFLSALAVGIFMATFKYHSNVWHTIEREQIWLAVMLTPLFFLSNFFNRICIGCNIIIGSNNINTLSSVVKLGCLMLFLVVMPDKIRAVLLANALSLAVVVVGCWLLVNNEPRENKIESGVMRASVRYGSNIYLALLISYLNLRMDVYLLKYYTTDAAVGFYSIAVAIAEMAWIIPESFSNVLFPAVASLDENNKYDRTAKVVKFNVMTMVFTALSIIIFAKIAIRVVYGAAYLPSYEPLLWIAPGIVAYPIVKILGVDLAARGNPGFVTGITALGFIINTITNVFLIPRYGASGAALASTISYCTMAITVMIYYMKVSGISLKSFLVLNRAEIGYIAASLKITTTK